MATTQPIDIKEEILEALEELKPLTSIYYEWWIEYLYDEEPNPVESLWTQKSLNAIQEDIEDHFPEVQEHDEDDYPYYY
jgi:hypothetical protein